MVIINGKRGAKIAPLPEKIIIGAYLPIGRTALVTPNAQGDLDYWKNSFPSNIG